MRIFASVRDEISEGFVWLQDAGLSPRCVARITSPEKKTVYCEALQLEANFLKHYNQPPRLTIGDPGSVIVMSGWYRRRLGGLETQKDYALEIVRADTLPDLWTRRRAHRSLQNRADAVSHKRPPPSSFS